jgi:copper(I)-binding protein
MKNIFIVLLTLMPMLAFAENNPSIETNKMWARATIGQSTTTAVYGIFENTTGIDDALIDVSTPLARVSQIHRTTMNDMGIMRMDHMEKVVLKNETFVVMEPGDIHIMLMGLNQKLEAGFEIPLKLEFENAPTRFVRVPVYPATTKFSDVK